MSPSRSDIASPSRRGFLKTTAAAAGAALAAAPVAAVRAQGAKRVFKVALIGCGGRGNGALRDHLDAVKYLNEKLNLNIEAQVVATADWFPNKAKGAGRNFGVPEDRCFGGPADFSGCGICHGDAVSRTDQSVR